MFLSVVLESALYYRPGMAQIEAATTLGLQR